MVGKLASCGRLRVGGERQQPRRGQRGIKELPAGDREVHGVMFSR